MSGAPSVDEIVNTLLQTAPALDAPADDLARNLYRGLARGEPVTLDALAASSGLSDDYVEATVASWRNIVRDHDDRIVGFGGLTLETTRHILEVNGIRLHTWCAWDTLFIPAILQARAAVRSTDPHNGRPVTLTVTAEGVVDRSDSGIVVSFLLPRHRPERAIDLISTFCHYVHFFTERDSGEQWTAQHDGTFLLGLDDAFTLGIRCNPGRCLS
jgi:alkylmercury lyase